MGSVIDSAYGELARGFGYCVCVAFKMQGRGHVLDRLFKYWLDFYYFSYFFENEHKTSVTKAIDSIVIITVYLISNTGFLCVFNVFLCVRFVRGVCKIAKSDYWLFQVYSSVSVCLSFCQSDCPSVRMK